MATDAVSVAVAKAVTVMLAAANLSKRFTPERSYADWELNLEDADCLHVDVVPVTTGQKIDQAVRGPKVKYVMPIDIAVRYRFGTAKQDDDTGCIEIAEIDALMKLVEEIYLLLIPVRPDDYEFGIWQQTEIAVLPHVGHLRENRQFTGVVRVTFRVDAQ